MSKKVVRIVAVLLAVIMAATILVSVLSAVASAAPSQAALDELKKQQDSIKQQMQDLESQINSLEFDQSVTKAKKEVLDEKVALTQQEIDNITEQIAEYENLIAEKELEAIELEEQEEEQWELYKTRIRAMQENGTISYYAIIFGANSFTDMLYRIDAVNSIMDYDTKVYNDLLAAEEATRLAKEAVEATKLEQEQKRVELQEAEEQLQIEVEEANQLLIDLEKNLTEYEALYEEQLEEQNKIQADIAEMEEELRKMNVSSVKGTGTFIWPAELKGKVTSYFGWRKHPLLGYYRNHNGIDIGGLGYGANILAADSGTVLTSAYSSSYGNYVTISHGNGYTTLYAHMSKRLVEKGDTVSQGDIIGLVGSTGLSTGPHLHFEVWLDGTRVDPLNYFSDYDVSPDCW